MQYFTELLAILNEMSPYLLLGFFLSGLLHVYVPRSIYAKFLQHRGLRAVLYAALLGVPLPLCSCGVIPTAVSLKKEGASDGAMTSFLIATPQTGIDSAFVTYSILGLPFAITRAVAAFVVAIISGVAVDRFGGKSQKKIEFSKMRFAPNVPNGATEQRCSCGCDHSKKNNNSHMGRFGDALRYGYLHMIQDFGKWLIIGLMIAAAITAFVPDSLFTLLKDHYLLNLLLILLLSAPMYICATGSIPIALSLMLKGLSPGAAFILLMAGPATNFAALFILKREIGVRKTIISLLSIILGAILCALVIDFVLPQDWFSISAPLHTCNHDHHHDHCNHGAIWWQTTTSIIFILLFINATIRGHISTKLHK